MALKHSVYDTDAHFKIDAITRVIKNDSSGKTVLIQGDHNSERFTFEVPRLVDGHDLSLCDVVQVHYINIDSSNKNNVSKDLHEVDDLQISPDDDGVVILSWLIDGKATRYAGSLNFAVKFKCTVGAVKVYEWNTMTYTGISISSGIDNGEAVVEDYSDVLEQWRQEFSEPFTLSNTAKVGQTVVISEVDADGQPKKWVAVDRPSNLSEFNNDLYGPENKIPGYCLDVDFTSMEEKIAEIEQEVNGSSALIDAINGEVI